MKPRTFAPNELIVIAAGKGRSETLAEKAERLGVPVIPATPAPTFNDTVAVCGKCGLELKGVMSYACGHYDCPTTTKTTNL